MASAEQPFDDREYVCNYSKLLYNVAHLRLIELVDLEPGKQLKLTTWCFWPQQRYFLAEILKVSSIAPLDLLNLIQSRGINANWNDIALPNGALEEPLIAPSRSQRRARLAGSALLESSPHFANVSLS